MSIDLNTLVGLEQSEAESKITTENMVCRVVAQDDKTFTRTMDYRTDRVNLAIKDGKVVEAKIG